MRRTSLAVLLAAFTVPLLSGTTTNTSAQAESVVTTQQAVPAPTPQPKPKRNGCKLIYSAKYHRSFAVQVYKRDEISRQARRKLKRLSHCQRSYQLEQKAKAFEKKQYALRQERKAIDALTPFGAWAIPGYIVMCESHGNFRARNSSSTAGGAYQILDSTWYRYGGTHYADSHPAAVAPPVEQHKIAGRVWANQGAGAWLCS